MEFRTVFQYCLAQRRPSMSLNKITRFFAAAVLSAGLSTALITTAADACAFDLIKPERTSVDWIVEAETLVLARPAPDNAFAYQITEVLRGEKTGQKVSLLVNSAYRKTLKRNPDHAVLLRKSEAGEWRQVAYVDDDFREVLDTVLSHANEWQNDYPPSRFDVFEALQSSVNPALRGLAIRELDKAPYDMLRTLDMKLPVGELLADLWTVEGYPYQSIRVLLLGLSGDDRARQEIYDYFARTQNWGWTNGIGAFAAALVELDGVAGVAYLDQFLLSESDQPIDKMQGVIQALAIHRGTADAEVAREIDTVLAALLDEKPEMASPVAQQFAAVSDWSQIEPLARLMKENRLMTTSDLLIVSVYVAQARGAAKSSAGMNNKG